MSSFIKAISNIIYNQLVNDSDHINESELAQPERAFDIRLTINENDEERLEYLLQPQLKNSIATTGTQIQITVSDAEDNAEPREPQLECNLQNKLNLAAAATTLNKASKYQISTPTEEHSPGSASLSPDVKDILKHELMLRHAQNPNSFFNSSENNEDDILLPDSCVDQTDQIPVDNQSQSQYIPCASKKSLTTSPPSPEGASIIPSVSTGSSSFITPRTTLHNVI